MSAPSPAPILLKAPNHFEIELGDLSAEQREQVIAALTNFMAEVRTLLRNIDQNFKVQNAQECQRCATCAFNPVTDSFPGFTPTAYGLMKSLRDETIFLCHANQLPRLKRENLIDPNGITLCKGFLLLTAFRPKYSRDVAKRASRTIKIASQNKKDDTTPA